MNKLQSALANLRGPSDFGRLDALDKLRGLVIREGNLGFGPHTEELYGTLNPLLVDSSWTVSSQTVELVETIIHVCGGSQRDGLCGLLPNLVCNLGVDLLRQAALKVLVSFLRDLGAVVPLIENLMKSGLKHRDFRVRQESLMGISRSSPSARTPSTLSSSTGRSSSTASSDACAT